MHFEGLKFWRLAMLHHREKSVV